MWMIAVEFRWKERICSNFATDHCGLGIRVVPRLYGKSNQIFRLMLLKRSWNIELQIDQNAQVRIFYLGFNLFVFQLDAVRMVLAFYFCSFIELSRPDVIQIDYNRT